MRTENENSNETNKPINYSLPIDYFRNNAISIAEKIEWLEEHKAFPLLNSIRNKSAFKIPESYFNEASNKIELLNSPILFKINKHNSFITPENYFERNESYLFNLLKPLPKTRIIRLYKKTFALAAAVLLITFSVYLYRQLFQIKKPDDCMTLACIEKRDLLKSRQLENLENEELYELINVTKLEIKLKNDSNITRKKIIESNEEKALSNELLDEI